MKDEIEIWEYLIGLVIAALGYLTVLSVDEKHRRAYAIGYAARIFGSLFYLGIYLFYYGGGDTTAYYKTAVPVVNLLFESLGNGLDVWFNPYSPERFSLFSGQTGYPFTHIYVDISSYRVSQILVPILIIGFKSYVVATLIMTMVFFYGPWMLYKMLSEILVTKRWIALVSVLVLPSVIFWGCGISKDTITFSAACYYTYAFYTIFIQRNPSIIRVVLLILALFLIISIKPYIFIVIFPGTVIWSVYSRVRKIKSVWLRRSILPFFFAISLVGISLLFSQLSFLLGSYSFENILEKAIVTQEDLKQDYYGGNHFDIGKITPTVPGILSKFPIATFYGLFGPTLLAANKVVVLFSALENTLLLLLSLRLFVVRPKENFNRLINNPLLLFSIIFVVLFGFAIGLTTPNYGALVRFKIPLMPFFAFVLLTLNYRAGLKKV